jgi:hypothetical protein
MRSSPGTARGRIPGLLPILAFLLALSPDAIAVNCNSPPTGSYGAAWASAYKSWCIACCGTFSMSGGNPSCSPGSNWGCKSQQGSSGAAPGMYNAFYQSGYQIGQGIGKLLFGDPQEEARKRAQAEMEAQRALQQNRQMMQSLDGMSKEQVREEDQASAEAAERARLAGDRQRQEALAALKGIPQADGELTLRGIPQADAELTLKPSTDFFGIPGNPKGDPSSLNDPSVVDLRRLDPGKPILVDNNVLGEAKKEKGRFTVAECERRKAARDRLAGGLPVQSEAIRRTEAQLAAARKGVGEAAAEKRQVLLQGAIREATEYAKDVLTSAKALRLQIERLKELEIDKAKRDLLIHSLNTVILEGEDLANSAKAGYEGGEMMRSKVDDLSRRILPLADKLLMESGIAEMVGEELSEKLGGPLGALGFRGAKLSIDFTVALGKGMISEAEREAAQRNLDTMRSQHRRAQSRIFELEKDLAEGCREVMQAHQ